MKEYLEKEIKKIRKKNGRGFMLTGILVFVVIFGGVSYDLGHFPKGLELIIEKNDGWILLGVVVVLVMLWHPIFKRINRYAKLTNQLGKLEEKKGG